MAGSSFGKFFKITTWGESHGKSLGVVVDGCPAGLEIDEDYIQKFLDRRKPGKSSFATKRLESDKIEIVSGVFEGKTTGTPIALLLFNEDQRSKDYSKLKDIYRPGHADFTFDKKYGFRDYRGGGRSSGRETVGRVAAGAIALKILKELNINIFAYSKEIAGVEIDNENFDLDERDNNSLSMPDKEAFEKATIVLKKLMLEKDSAGGIVECVIKGLKPGIGEPVFDKLDANLAKGIFSIGGVKGFEIGKGFGSSKEKGSTNNDEFYFEDGVKKKTNNAGGILGGISDGDDIILRGFFKPTPSISKEQNTISNENQNVNIEIKGRHDPIIVPRAVVVVEAMAGLVVLDLVFENMLSNMKSIIKIINGRVELYKFNTPIKERNSGTPSESVNLLEKGALHPFYLELPFSRKAKLFIKFLPSFFKKAFHLTLS